jgi:hypothetical protein
MVVNCKPYKYFREISFLQLGEVAEIEAQMFSFAQKFNRRTAVEISTEPAILPNCLLATGRY